MKGVVYNIKLNDKVIYIGSTIDLKRRISHHKCACYNTNNKDYKKSYTI